MTLQKYVLALKACIFVSLAALVAGSAYYTLTSENLALYVALLVLVFSPLLSLLVLAYEAYRSDKKIFFLSLTIATIMLLNIMLLAGGI